MASTLEPEIRTPRLLLRPVAIADVPAVRRLAGDERVSRYTARIPYPYPCGAAETFVAGIMEQHARDEARVFAITLTDAPDDLIGTIMLEEKDGGSVEIGYWLGVPYWGRGLTGEAVSAVAEYAGRWRPGAPLVALTFPENVASQRVLEKAGFRRTGLDTCDAPARGRVVEDASLYVFEPDTPGVTADAASPGRESGQ